MNSDELTRRGAWRVQYQVHWIGDNRFKGIDQPVGDGIQTQGGTNRIGCQSSVRQDFDLRRIVTEGVEGCLRSKGMAPSSPEHRNLAVVCIANYSAIRQI